MMSLDLTVRTLKAVAAFDPDANLGNLVEKIDELQDALARFRSKMNP